MPAWSGVLAATIDKHLRDEMVDTVIKKKTFLKLLYDRGRINYRGSGPNITKRIRYKRAPIQANSELLGLSFPQRDKRKVASFDMRGYVVSQGLSEWSLIQNQGPEAIINLYASIGEELLDDIRYGFNKELIQTDGYAVGNETKVCGLESMFGNTGSLINNKVLSPSDTYGTLSTALAAYGGTFTPSNTWPEGSGDTQYDFWSPLIVKASASGWAAATDNWQNNSVEIIRFIRFNTERNGDKTDVFLMSSTHLQDHMKNLDSKENIFIRRGQTDAADTGFGFNVVYQDGIMLTWDVDVASGTSYALCVDALELINWPIPNNLYGEKGGKKQQLFHYMETYDHVNQAVDACAKAYLNLVCWNPRVMAKIVD